MATKTAPKNPTIISKYFVFSRIAYGLVQQIIYLVPTHLVNVQAVLNQVIDCVAVPVIFGANNPPKLPPFFLTCL